MRKQIRGAMLALAAMAGIAGQAQSVRINAPLSVRQGKDMTQTPANAPAASISLRNTSLASRTIIPGGFMQEPIWMARSKRGNRGNRSRHDYGR